MQKDWKFFILILNFYYLKSIVFNPIISEENGNPLVVNNSNIIGWLDIPTYNNRIMAMKEAANIRPIYPLDINLALPQGLYCWSNNWEKFIDEEEYFYEGLYKDAFYFKKISTMNPKNILYVSSNPKKINGYFLNKQSNKWFKKYKSMGILIPWNPKVNKKTIDFSKTKADDDFYNIMGVSEKYFREFLGSDLKEVNKELNERDIFNMPHPELTYVNRYFPINNTFFCNRKIIECDLCIDSIESLSKKNNFNSGKIQFIDNVTNHKLIKFQNNIKNNNAVFHIITTFNGLESDIETPIHLISEYKNKSGACIQSMIFRKYYAKSINLLEKLNDKIKVENGKIKEIIKPLDDKDIEKIDVIWQANIKLNNKQTLHYAITGLFQDEPIDDKTKKIILCSCYIGAIKLAQYYDKKDLFLFIPANLKEDALNIFNTEKLKNLIKTSKLNIIGLIIK